MSFLHSPKVKIFILRILSVLFILKGLQGVYKIYDNWTLYKIFFWSDYRAISYILFTLLILVVGIGLFKRVKQAFYLGFVISGGYLFYSIYFLLKMGSSYYLSLDAIQYFMDTILQYLVVFILFLLARPRSKKPDQLVDSVDNNTPDSAVEDVTSQGSNL